MLSFLIAVLAGCPRSALPSQPVHGYILSIPVTCDYEMYRLVGVRWLP